MNSNQQTKMTPKPPQISVDDRIAQENQLRRQYEAGHVVMDGPVTKSRVLPLPYLGDSRLLVIAVVGAILVLVVIMGLVQFAASQSHKPPIGTIGQSADATDTIAYEDVYGLPEAETGVVDGGEERPVGDESSGDDRATNGAPSSDRQSDGPSENVSPGSNNPSSGSDQPSAGSSGSATIEPAPASPPPPRPPAPAPSPPPEPVTKEATISVASWNANYNNTVSTVVGHIKNINADVIGLQEMGNPTHSRNIIRGITNCSRCSYAAFLPSGHGAHAVPIAWKKSKFKLLATGSFQVNEAQVINDGGSRTNLLDKSTNWVKLQERTTGLIFYLSNNHLVPSVELNGRPYPNRQKRLAMYYEHMDGIVRTINKARRGGHPIFVTGDFNVNYRADSREQTPRFPYARFKSVNVFANWYYLGKPSTGTHRSGTRLIDYVHLTKTKQIRPLSQKIMAKGGSDHKPVYVKLRLRN